MHVLDSDKVALLQQLFASGFSLRKAAKAAGVAKGTAQRYRTLSACPRLCACNKVLGHKGWCKVRFAASSDRQIVLKMMRAAPNWRARLQDPDLVFDVVRKIMRTKGPSIV